MLRRLPQLIDPLRMAETGRELEGELPLAEMSRLAKSLTSTDGSVEVKLEFGTDQTGFRYLKGSIRGNLKMCCQRCMQPMPLDIKLDVNLVLVSSNAEADRLQSDNDVLLVESDTVKLADIIEDELILALPIVPLHDIKQCPAAEYINQESESTENTEKESPFSVLAELNSNKQPQE